jgi:hypothetical protein
MPRVVSVRALAGHSLEVVFQDGVRGIVPMEDRLFGPVFEPLRNEEFFRSVFVDEFGVVCWPNGADLAPDALYDRVRSDAGLVATGGRTAD